MGVQVRDGRRKVGEVLDERRSRRNVGVRSYGTSSSFSIGMTLEVGRTVGSGREKGKWIK